MRPIITTNGDDHTGLAVVRSLGKNNIDFNVVSQTKYTLALSSRFCRNKTVGPVDLDFFLKLPKEDTVFPVLEDTMLLLSKHASRLRCQLGFSDYQTLQTAMDKSLLIQHAIEHKIPCPKTFFITKPEDIQAYLSEVDFPVILKPGRGAGGKGICSIGPPGLTPEIAEKFLRDNGHFLVQERIPFDTKYTIGALCNSDNKLKRICVIKERRNYPVETGQACYVETVNEPRLVKFAEKLLSSLNFFGIADIDLVIDNRDNQPKLMEINPRFWGSMQVAINAGMDFPCLLNTMLTDGDIEKSYSYKTGVCCRYILYTDLIRLITVLRGDYPPGYKKESLRQFFRIPVNDGYYVYDIHDVMPFFLLTYIKLLRKIGI